jgi:hypothetical protein
VLVVAVVLVVVEEQMVQIQYLVQLLQLVAVPLVLEILHLCLQLEIQVGQVAVADQMVAQVPELAEVELPVKDLLVVLAAPMAFPLAVVAVAVVLVV